MNVYIKFRNGNTRRFDGSMGSQYPKVEYEGVVATVIDEYGGKISFPLDTIEHIETSAPPRSSW